MEHRGRITVSLAGIAPPRCVARSAPGRCIKLSLLCHARGWVNPKLTSCPVRPHSHFWLSLLSVFSSNVSFTLSDPPFFLTLHFLFVASSFPFLSSLNLAVAIPFISRWFSLIPFHFIPTNPITCLSCGHISSWQTDHELWWRPEGVKVGDGIRQTNATAVVSSWRMRRWDPVTVLYLEHTCFLRDDGMSPEYETFQNWRVRWIQSHSRRKDRGLIWGTLRPQSRLRLSSGGGFR